MSLLTRLRGHLDGRTTIAVIAQTTPFVLPRQERALFSMADPTTDAPVKTPDAPVPAAQQAGANLDASAKAATEVYSAPAPAGTATQSDAAKPPADTSLAAP